MRISANVKMCLCSSALLLAMSQAAHGQIMYRWSRTQQELGARSNVTVTATGDTSQTLGGNLPRVITNQDFLFLGDSQNASRVASGGEGGGGGDDGNVPNPISGDHGDDFTPFDGEGGIGDFGGDGGFAGDNGQATSSGTTVAIDELNPDFQTALSYSWIHNQWGDLNIRAAGGGGGGGAGTDSAYWDPVFEWWMPLMGAPGGDGGRGRDASGSITNSQDSDVLVSATCVVDPAISPPPSSTPPIDCSITLDMGWVSAPNPDWINGAPGTSPWARTIGMNIRAGNSTVNIQGGPTGTIVAWAVDDAGIPYFKESVDVLDGDTGSFGLGAGEIGVTQVAPGQFCSIVTAPNGINSTLTGSMAVEGGWGGTGSWGPGGGSDGLDGGFGLGAPGGPGGDGGGDRPFDFDRNGQNEGEIPGGGDGGDGGNGDHINEHKDGIYQGVVVIMMG